MNALTLEALVQQMPTRLVRGSPKTQIHGIQHDSRAVQAGDLFVAIRGEVVDGAQFAKEAITRGAAALLADRDIDVAVPLLISERVRSAMAAAAHTIYGHPTLEVATVGITGTNGKTTTAWLLDSVLRRAGATPALLSTVLRRGPGVSLPATHTTPEADDLARFARRVVEAGATHLVMEVSSHALAMERVDGTHFAVAALTNLSPDHLDFHETMETYAAAKARLFEQFDVGTAVVNVDDAFGQRIAGAGRGELLRCSRGADLDADVCVLEWSDEPSGLRARIRACGAEMSVRLRMAGAHNLDNALVAIGCAKALGVDDAAIAAGLETAEAPPGRLERIGDANAYVDYAHTPEALRCVLTAVRRRTSGRLIAIFGCGGNRDRQKRRPMGAIAGALADLVIATTDNPRDEPADSILAEIEAGLSESGLPRVSASTFAAANRGYVVVEDRREAIGLAASVLGPTDTLVLTGKGHERSQEIAGVRYPFDDREELARAMEDLRGDTHAATRGGA